MENRGRARELAAAYVAKGDPTGWFEQLYREAEAGESVVPWADRQPNPNLIDFWNRHSIPSSKTALVIGCGLGDDAEQLAGWGFETTAFDISPAAIEACNRRFPKSRVRYETANLFCPFPQWFANFDFVFESYTLQVLPRALRKEAMKCMACLVKMGGHLLVIARGKDAHEAEGSMPWPLTRDELAELENFGLREISFEDYMDQEKLPVRRFRALYRA
ncbi:MAG TPA: class I SAM-dependent methyltransferase [Bryobacteraceae bacterium]|nr:class I SAM-dependent methyltransferase [Bryobacteraceae bacterium]